MKEIGSDELKIVQMDVLTAFDEFCISNNIHYTLGCGTLIGAVRHKGYIPWDDDIDICLIRSEYNRMLNLFPNDGIGKYKLLSMETNPKWDRPYAIVYDDETILEEHAFNPLQFGVKIDVFPVDDVPEDEGEWIRYKSEIAKKTRLYGYMGVRNGANWIKTLVFKILHIFTLLIGRRHYADYINKMIQKYNGKGYVWCYETCQGTPSGHPLSKKVFDSYKRMQFEDRTYMTIEHTHEYLSNMYGDYMQFPPREERVTRHGFTAYWK